jgi:hypothetical protein
VYFPHRTFVSDVSEIPISFPFPELPFFILFLIKNMKTVMVLVFTDRFRPFSSLWRCRKENDGWAWTGGASMDLARREAKTARVGAVRWRL